jgi:hypothetical protein
MDWSFVLRRVESRPLNRVSRFKLKGSYFKSGMKKVNNNSS